MNQPKGRIISPRSQTYAPRIPAVDGLRGLLALLVLLHHAAEKFDETWTLRLANMAVLTFFMISGYVLTRSWDGDFLRFLLRRFVRLWPVYAACLGIAYGIAGEHTAWPEFFWWPIKYGNDPAVLKPSWSLTVEAWAMVFMPMIVWVAQGSFMRFAWVIALLAMAVRIYSGFAFGVLFVFGALMYRLEFRNKALEAKFPQWLGKISYSLYLSHWLVLSLAWRAFGTHVGSVIATPAALAVGWLVWWAVERPSILASRRMPSMTQLTSVWKPPRFAKGPRL